MQTEIHVNACFIHVLANIAQFLQNTRNDEDLARLCLLLISLLGSYSFQESQNCLWIKLWNMDPAILSFEDASDASYQSLVRLLHCFIPENGLPVFVWSELAPRLRIVMHLYEMIYPGYGNEVIGRSLMKTIAGYTPSDEDTFHKTWSQYTELQSFALKHLTKKPAKWREKRWKAAAQSYMRILGASRDAEAEVYYGDEWIIPKKLEIVQELHKELWPW